jgi:hypothetical protein
LENLGVFLEDRGLAAKWELFSWDHISVWKKLNALNKHRGVLLMIAVIILLGIDSPVSSQSSNLVFINCLLSACP